MKNLRISIIVFLSMVLFTINTNSQNYNLNKENSSITVSGTSSLHDWDVIAERFNGVLRIGDIQNAELIELRATVISESLKSGKNGMDKNTYKALNTSEYKTITFKMVKVNSCKKINASTFEINLNGSMTIIGVTKVIPIKVLFSNTDNSINLTGSCTFKMTGFGIEPPKALFGTIKTGDQITIKFNTNFIKE